MVALIMPQCFADSVKGEIMSRKIDSIRRRVVSAYPQWNHWSNLQKSLLILRATHGKINRPIDLMHPTTKSYARALNLIETDVEELFTDGIAEALEDYDKTGAFKKGTRKNGLPMKRPTNPEEMMVVFSYELAPSSLISVLSGYRKSLTLPELEQMKLWTATTDMVQTVRYVDSSRKQEQYLREEKQKLQKKVWELEEKLNPKTPEELIEEGFEHTPDMNDEYEEPTDAEFEKAWEVVDKKIEEEEQRLDQLLEEEIRREEEEDL